MAMTSGLLSEPEPGRVAHSAVSALFLTNPNFLLWAEFMTECSAPTAARFADATQKWPGSANKTETAYNIAFDTDLPFFDHLATVPKRTEQFAGYMKSVTSSEGTDLKHLVSGYDWASLGKATVVDVRISLTMTFHGCRPEL
jgi:6-hydroxytryprostatin B O-methyltransferase